MFRNLSQAYHFFRKDGVSPSEAMTYAKEIMAATSAQHEAYAGLKRRRAEQKYRPYEMDELKLQHKGHFFDPDTMRFFKSRVGDKVYGGSMFITSERGPHSGRAYSVRRVTKSGAIKTVGPFQGYTSKSQAERAIARLMKQTKARRSR
jgi:hypothetical protein